MMKKLFIICAIIFLGFNVAYAAPYFRQEATIVPITNNLYDLGTTTRSWRNLYVNSITASSSVSLPGLGNSMLTGTNASGVLVSTSTPTMAALYATSTTATSTFAGYVNITGANSTSTISGHLRVVGNVQVDG